MEEVSIREKHELLENLVSLRRLDYTAYIAAICMIVSMLIDDGKMTAEEAVLKDGDLANASKGELKRAIKVLRTASSGDPGFGRAVERTVQYIRRDLLHKEERTA